MGGKMESQREKKFWWPARIRTLAFVALLGLHNIIGARAQERDDVSARTDPTIQAEAARFRYQRLQGVISLFIQAANSDGPLGENIRQTLRDRQAVLFNQNTLLLEGVRVVC
jgi:hypothetical protein